MRITFKRHRRETGLAGIGHPHPNVDIKVDGKVVGQIAGPCWSSEDNLWVVSVMVENGGGWDWRKFKSRYIDEASARAAVTLNLSKIAERYILHHDEDD